MPLGQSQCIPQADPGGVATPRFLHRLIRFRHVISGSLALASLNHTCRNLVPTFPQRSPPSLLTTAACSGLRSAPDCRPRRTFLHLSYSYASPCGPALLVTQDPNQTCREVRRFLRSPPLATSGGNARRLHHSPHSAFRRWQRQRQPVTHSSFSGDCRTAIERSDQRWSTD